MFRTKKGGMDMKQNEPVRAAVGVERMGRRVLESLWP